MIRRLVSQASRWRCQRLPTIGSLLTIVILFTALPAIIGLGMMVEHFYKRERALIFADSSVHARAILKSVERDLGLSLAVTHALATSPSLRNSDFESFYQEARAALRPDFPGLNFVLSGPDGTQVINTVRPFGTRLSDTENLVHLTPVFQTGRAYVSNVFIGGVLKRPLVAAHVPVELDERVKYVLSVGVAPDRIARVFDEQPLSKSRGVVVLDASGALVTHSGNLAAFIQSADVSVLVSKSGRQLEGSLDLTTAEGIPVHAVYSRSKNSGWTVVVAIPRTEVLRDVLRSVTGISAGVVALFSIGLLVAILLARRVTAAMKEFGRAASSLSQRTPITSAPMIFHEAQEGMLSLVSAEAELNRHREGLEEGIAQRTVELKAALLSLGSAERTSQVGAQRMATILANALDAFIGMDIKGRITEWNKQAETVFGWPSHDVLGRPVADVLIPARYRGAQAEELHEFLTTGSTTLLGRRLRVDAVRRGGEEFPVEMTISASETAGEVSFHAFVTDVSERVRMDEQLESERVLLNTVLDTIDIAVVACDRAGGLTLFNRASKLFHNLDAENIPQEEWAGHFALYEEDGTTPFATERIPLLRALAGEIVDRVPMVIACRNAAPRALMASGRRLIDPQGALLGAVVVMSDVTEENAAAWRLKASERFLRTITDNSPALISYVDLNERYLFANASYKRLLGLEPAFVVGKSMHELMGDDAYELLRPHIARVLAGEKVHFEPDFRKTQFPFYFMTDYIPDVGPSGDVVGFHIMVTDISERKEAELVQAQSKQIAENANKAKSEFVANMSHEIRTPMNAVLGIAQLLEKTSLTAGQKKYLTMLQASGKALLAIIDDILDFSKIEAGRLTLASSPFHLSEIIHTTAAIMTASARDKNLELIIGVEPNVPLSLIGDATRLQQALHNLVGNAVKFTETGEIVLSIEEVRREADVSTLCFRVSDTGIGMSEEQLRRLYTPFEQADSSTSRRFGGTGLGLAISKQLVELMGGKIETTSAVGVGSSFSITVPMKIFSSKTTNDATPVGSRNVLIIDDHAQTRAYLAKMVRGWQCSATCVSSIDEAIEHIQAQKFVQSYDTLLLDWSLHLLSAGTVSDLLSMGGFTDKPAVLKLANAFELARVAPGPAATDAEEFLIKPITPSILFDALNSAFYDTSPAFELATSNDTEAQLRGIRVLLVEDNQLNQIVAGAMLEGEGAIVTTVSDGREAVELLARAASSFDIVLMDIQMPVMDGYEATGRIRTLLGSRLPIVAMSAGVMIDERELCLAAGMDDFIAKPVDMDVMISTMQRHVDTHQSGHLEKGNPESWSIFSNAVFDISSLERLSVSNPQGRLALVELVARALSRAPDELRESQRLFEAGNVTSATGILHGLRGCLGSIGGKRFAVECANLEQALVSEQFAQINLFYVAVQRELQALQATAGDWVETQRD